MILTPEQEQAVKIAVERYKKGEKYTVIAGYSGTGKSSTVSYIIEALDVSLEDVAFVSYTGKSAQVLAQKGNENATTLHHLLYNAHINPDGSYSFTKKTKLPYKIVVVDEISMVPNWLIDDLFSFNCYVICLGDPFQIPPVSKEGDNHLLDHPHIFLSEIMRQDVDSEIIQLSMKIRNFQPVIQQRGKDVLILDKKELNTGMLQWADQIIVATNKTRININNQMRKLNNKTSINPMNGDKLICCRNYWETLSNADFNLMNGTIGYLENCFQDRVYFPYKKGSVSITVGDFATPTMGTFSDLSMDTKLITTGVESLTPKEKYKYSKMKKTMRLVPTEFSYGYAITCHRAQGSEWDKVLVIEEGFPYEREEHARWLYTACTRSVQKLVLLR